MIKIPNNLKPGVIKALAGNKFISEISKNIEVKKEETVKSSSAITSISRSSYDMTIGRGIEALKRFISIYPLNEKYFKQAVEYLSQANRLKPSKPEPYFYLAYIFHIFGDNNTALKYTKTVKFINPDFDGLDILESDISNSLNHQNIDFISVEKDDNLISTDNKPEQIKSTVIRRPAPVSRVSISGSVRKEIRRI